ncbi:MAG: Hsp33 family molecular chaperone HslO [Magnetospiraceae bacterium]
MTTPQTLDLVVPFQVRDTGPRGRMVRLGPAIRDALDHHEFHEPAKLLAAEAMALTALMATALKFDGLFTLQAQGDGPLSPLVIQINSEGHLRAYGKFDAEAFATARSSEPVPRLLGNGSLSFIVEQRGKKDRYQGMTDLGGATLADCAHTYFKNSEQIDTAIKLCTDGNFAAGMMVQRLPDQRPLDQEENDEIWRESVILMGSVTNRELLDPSLAPEEVLFRLYHEDGVRVFKRRDVVFQCRCSRDQVGRTLSAFPRGEIADMAEDGNVGVTCEFCKRDYVFALSELEREWNAEE